MYKEHFEKESVETAAASESVVYVSPEAWAEFEALDSPAVWDDEDEDAWLETLEDGPLGMDDDFGPCSILFRLLGLW